jgi:hypothetical protein
MKVYRWDLDKTYLDTDFHSLRGLVRTATEPAHRKNALPGAASLLRALSHRVDARVTVVSGSPIQMRHVLREKLALDGIRFDELVLKDNLGNVRKGRLRAVRGQLGYKLPALLEARTRTNTDATEVLFGDDVESDALVYSVYADAISGKVGAAGVSRIMERAGAYPDEIDRALAALVGIEHSEAVERIFIRQERGVPSHRLAALGRRVVPIRSWWQAALVLKEMGHIHAEELHNVMQAVYENEGEDPWAMAALAQDMLRRDLVQNDTVLSIRSSQVLDAAIQAAVASLDGRGAKLKTDDGMLVDYLALLDSGAWNSRGRAKK